MHPEHDCEDCGVLHTPWSEHERARRVRADHAGEAILIMEEIRKVIAGRDPLAVSMALHELDLEYF